jgi:hypothetical protein
VLLSTSTMPLSRVTGDGGENSQRMTAVPEATAHHAACATLKSPVQPLVQFDRAPDAKDHWPGMYGTPRNRQPPGPLQTSFCKAESNVVLSGVTVVEDTQPLLVTDTFCRRVASNVMYDCWPVAGWLLALMRRSRIILSPTLAMPPLGGEPAWGTK